MQKKKVSSPTIYLRKKHSNEFSSSSTLNQKMTAKTKIDQPKSVKIDSFVEIQGPEGWLKVNFLRYNYEDALYFWIFKELVMHLCIYILYTHTHIYIHAYSQWSLMPTHFPPSKSYHPLSISHLPEVSTSPNGFSSVQSLSRVRLFATPWIIARQTSLSITNSWSSLRFTSIESVMPFSHLILCRPLLLLSPIPPSISLFQWVNSYEVAKVLEFQL